MFVVFLQGMPGRPGLPGNKVSQLILDHDLSWTSYDNVFFVFVSGSGGTQSSDPRSSGTKGEQVSSKQLTLRQSATGAVSVSLGWVEERRDNLDNGKNNGDCRVYGLKHTKSTLMPLTNPQKLVFYLRTANC